MRISENFLVCQWHSCGSQALTVYLWGDIKRVRS